MSAGPVGCSFNTMNSSIAKFFTSSTQQKTVKELQSEMKTARDASDTAATRSAGYDIFRAIAWAVEAGAVGSVPDGSDLTNLVTACMFFGASELPPDFPHDYTTELTPSTQGAFAVRGGPADATAAVLARGTSPISGLAPQDGYTWRQSLGTVPAPSRVLFYGKPSALPDAYDWKAIPANATFTPGLVVGLCDPGGAYMIYESNGSILPYVDASFIGGPCPVSTAAATLWQRALAAARQTLLPRSAIAAMMNPGGLGGIGKAFSTFSPYEVGSVTISYTAQPHDASVLPSDACPTTPIGDPYDVGPVTFHVTKNGIAVGGTAITLTQINNNGTPATLCGNTSGMTDSNGYLTLNGIGLTKTGGYSLVASGSVPGRTITSNSATSDKFNIRP